MQAFVEKLRFYDYHGYLFFHGAIHGRDWLNGSYLFFAKYGIAIVILSFIYLILRRKIHAFICSFFSAGIAIIADFMIMLFWKRPRPFVSHSEILTPIVQGLRVDRISFPSAHTYIAFAIATSVYLYGHKKLGAFLYLMAFLIGIGRIGAGLHYPSDIIAGALLGIASGIAGYLIIQARQKNWE